MGAADLCLILLACAFSSAKACSCYDGPNKTYADFVCRNALVIRAHVLDQNTTATEEGHAPLTDRVIRFKTISMFRNTANISEPTVLTTPAGSAMCEQGFEQDKEYLIMGVVDGTNFSTNLCRHNKRWDLLTPEVKQGLENGTYAEGCTKKAAIRRSLLQMLQVRT